MAENSSVNISDLFLEEGIPIPYFLLVLTFVYGGVSIILPLLVVGILFSCFQIYIYYHVDRCPHCINLTSTRTKCKKSSIRWMMKFCSIIERFTVWLLVDLFRTPKVEKVLIKEKLCLKVLDREVQTDSGIPLIFLSTSFLFCLYITKVILDIFVTITPTCISEGDFGYPAICYADVHESSIHYQINCTTWNENYELLQETTRLFCVSFFFPFLTTLAKLAGLYGLQVMIIRIMLSTARRIFKRTICGFFISLLPLNITSNIVLSRVGNTKLYQDILFQQFPAMGIFGGSYMLSYYLLLSINHRT